MSTPLSHRVLPINDCFVSVLSLLVVALAPACERQIPDPSSEKSQSDDDDDDDDDAPASVSPSSDDDDDATVSPSSDARV